MTTRLERDPRIDSKAGDVLRRYGLKGGTYKIRLVGPRGGLVHLIRDDNRRIPKPMKEFVRWAETAKVIHAAAD